MNRQVNLTKRVKTSQDLRFCSVVTSVNGRIKPDWVVIAGKEERYPESAYYLEWYDGLRRVRRSVGKDAATAAARRHRQEQVLASKAASIKLIEEGSANGPLLADTVVCYLDEIKFTKKLKTYAKRGKNTLRIDGGQVLLVIFHSCATTTRSRPSSWLGR